jgi:hypothetical protein
MIASNYRPKTLIVVSNTFHLRSIIESELLTGMNESFEIILALDRALSSESQHPQVKEVYFSTSSVNQYISNLIMDSGTWKFRHLSSSFRYRIKRRLMGDISFNKLSSMRKVKFFLRYAKNLMKYLLLGNYLSNYILRFINEFLQKRECEIIEIMHAENPDIVLIWSQTLDAVSSAFICNSRSASIPNMLIADNWDNLFSKTVFPISPDFVGCYGEQSANFGSKLHDIPRDRFVELGSARFDVYRSLPRVESRRLVIFAGSSMPEDDEKILGLIDQVRAETSTQVDNQNLAWRYRPHPAPQHTIGNFADSFPGFEFTNHTNKTGEIRWPSLDASAIELANTRVAICMPTSYLLEALACEVPVIIPVFTNMVGLTTSKTLMSSLAHLKDLNKLPGVFIATSASEFNDQLTRLIVKDSRIKPTKELDFFINWTQSSFLNNLSDAIFKIANKTT